MREEIRFRVPPGPNQRRDAALLLTELMARVQDEEDEIARRKKVETEEHDVLEGEIVEDTE